uniref:Xanthine dehydrogenase small subunit n=1 Tax=Candidatus Kentrum sp. FW TaxID=2126338 RepID=A0A450T2G2_9GAMM|nr:MAG: xanthine dehydrogenase small subunit [Candidatus Kentron sp. FW]
MYKFGEYRARMRVAFLIYESNRKLNMIDFILNDQNVRTDAPSAGVVLDFLRDSQRLIGTREGCREGGCGSCLVLVGEQDGESLSYRPMNSCLLPLAEIQGKHVVTIEGLNLGDGHALNPIQRAIVEEGATQCGYCTPGIVVALTGFFLGNPPLDERQAIAAISGNICRCTGYQSIKRAIARLCEIFPDSGFDSKKPRIDWSVGQGILPAWFSDIPNRLQGLAASPDVLPGISPETIIVGGGTDLWAEQPDKLYHADLVYLSHRKELRGIRVAKGRCHIGAMTTFEEIGNSSIMQGFFPDIRAYFELMASHPIRCRGTVGGNIVNASPTGDLCIFFLATGASITLNDGHDRRRLPIKDFFQGYKKRDKRDDEVLEGIDFPVPTRNSCFNFEKVSQRGHFDTASVNSAIQVTVDDGIIRQIHLSAGGVSPVPLYLSATTDYLMDKKIDTDVIDKAISITQTEISPISDEHGSADYKRLLLGRLIHAHFITLFPEKTDP